MELMFRIPSPSTLQSGARHAGSDLKKTSTLYEMLPQAELSIAPPTPSGIEGAKVVVAYCAEVSLPKRERDPML